MMVTPWSVETLSRTLASASNLIANSVVKTPCDCEKLGLNIADFLSARQTQLPHPYGTLLQLTWLCALTSALVCCPKSSCSCHPLLTHCNDRTWKSGSTHYVNPSLHLICTLHAAHLTLSTVVSFESLCEQLDLSKAKSSRPQDSVRIHREVCMCPWAEGGEGAHSSFG